MAGRMLSVRQVAHLLGVHKDTVMRLVKRGELPAMKVGHLVRIPEGSLDAWTARRLQEFRQQARPFNIES